MATNPPPSPNSTVQMAWRVGSEFFSGILVGLIFGYGIDYFFSTNPWGMVIMILLGTAAGFRNIFKLVQPRQKKIELDNTPDEGQDNG